MQLKLNNRIFNGILDESGKKVTIKLHFADDKQFFRYWEDSPANKKMVHIVTDNQEGVLTECIPILSPNADQVDIYFEQIQKEYGSPQPNEVFLIEEGVVSSFNSREVVSASWKPVYYATDEKEARAYCSENWRKPDGDKVKVSRYTRLPQLIPPLNEIVYITLLSTLITDELLNDGFQNIIKWTTPKGGLSTIHTSPKRLYNIFNAEEMFNLMLGRRISITRKRFETEFTQEIFPRN